MSIISTITGWFTGLSIINWVEIGAGAATLTLIGGLYWYGHDEAQKVDALNQKIGSMTKTIADDKATLDGYKTAITNWETAFAQYQKNAQTQAAVNQAADGKKEVHNAQAQAVATGLQSNPVGEAVDATNEFDNVLCLLNAASAGTDNGCTPAAPDKSGAAGAVPDPN